MNSPMSGSGRPPPTPEQREIIRCDAPLLAVNAFAGTGKTSTLLSYADARPDQRILYLAFNKSVALEARSKFPRNVRVMTSHALAWHEIAKGWPEAKLRGKFSAWTIRQSLGDAALGGRGNAQNRAKWLYQVVCGFTQSDADDVVKFAMSGAGDGLWDSLQMRQREAAELINATWAKLCDPKDSLVATHDVYFKLWQLSRPVLDYDVILLDEAQDTNPALFDVFRRQAHAKRVLVGDRHQNIYGFRGAMNAMEQLEESHTDLALTQSFRFGQPVADVANVILSLFKREQRKITGVNSAPCSILYPGAPPFAKPGSLGTTGMLFRTNAGLFFRAATLASKRSSFGLIGRFEDYAFDDILDTYYLAAAKMQDIKNTYIRSFRHYGELVTYAKSNEDRELLARISLVEDQKHAIPVLYQSIKDSINSIDPRYVLTTAHKSKGAEWPNVILAEDFPDLIDQDSHMPRVRKMVRPEDVLSDGEANLLYVAATRAQHNLAINTSLADLLTWLSKTSKTKGKLSTETVD